MFDLFQRAQGLTTGTAVDRNLIRDRLAEALRDGGLDPEGKSFAALFKLLSDDLDWYFDQAHEDED